MIFSECLIPHNLYIYVGVPIARPVALAYLLPKRRAGFININVIIAATNQIFVGGGFPYAPYSTQCDYINLQAL